MAFKPLRWLGNARAALRVSRDRFTDLPYRAMHGFRRAVAGDVLEFTRDVKLALDWIGDVDLGMRVATCGHATPVSKRRPPPWTAYSAKSATETVT